MTDTGDRQPPKDPTPDHDPDDLVGFASPASLAGRPRAPEPEPEPAPAPASEPATDPEPVAAAEPALPAADPIVSAPAAPPPPAPEPEPTFGRREREAVPEAPIGLNAVYALILFAVPTFGVSAIIGLASVLFRDAPTEEPWASHHLYQLRTLWAAAIVAVIGVILIVVNLGVFVLFALVIWLVIRGAWGVRLATRGRAVPNPRGWWVG
jgi:uncharacterized membrane protein